MVRIVRLVNRAARVVAGVIVGWIVIGILLELVYRLWDRLEAWAEDPGARCVICRARRGDHGDDVVSAGHPFVDPASELAPMYARTSSPIERAIEGRGGQRSPGRPDLREAHALAGELAWSKTHPPRPDEPIDVQLVRLTVDPTGARAAGATMDPPREWAPNGPVLERAE